MEEEKKDWVEKFSKDELIEDIQREFASDAQNDIGCGGFLLLLLVYNVLSQAIGCLNYGLFRFFSFHSLFLRFGGKRE